MKGSERVIILGSRHFRSFKSWSELLSLGENPTQTSLSFALGVWIGTTPMLGVHSWLSLGLAPLMRLPPATALLGSNVSNPLTFLPITLLEIRIGMLLLARDFSGFPNDLSPASIVDFVVEAWLGWLVLGPLASVLLGGALFLSLRLIEWRRG